MTIAKNLFATVLTYPAPAGNYRGESEDTYTPLQKLSIHGQDFPFISADSQRNALRELLQQAGLPCNRSRLYGEGQPAVEFQSYPDANKYADDFFFGFMVVDSDAIKKNPKKPAKRDSVLKMNLAVATTPYQFDTVFHQSPMNRGKSPWKNSTSSVPLSREVSFNSFQYPFALLGRDCEKANPAWVRKLLESIGTLTGVAGGHARHYYEMAPASLIVRLTSNIVAGFNTYGFDSYGDFPELARINKDDLPGNEFWLGGEIVRKMDKKEEAHLRKEGVTLIANPQKLIERIVPKWLGLKE